MVDSISKFISNTLATVAMVGSLVAFVALGIGSCERMRQTNEEIERRTTDSAVTKFVSRLDSGGVSPSPRLDVQSRPTTDELIRLFYDKGYKDGDKFWIWHGGISYSMENEGQHWENGKGREFVVFRAKLEDGSEIELRSLDRGEGRTSLGEFSIQKNGNAYRPESIEGHNSDMLATLYAELRFTAAQYLKGNKDGEKIRLEELKAIEKSAQDSVSACQKAEDSVKVKKLEFRKKLQEAQKSLKEKKQFSERREFEKMAFKAEARINPASAKLDAQRRR